MDNNAPDLSKIISIIMENPGLINEIKSLAEGKSEAAEEPLQEKKMTEEVSVIPTVTKAGEPESAERKNRQRLLSAFKPYVSGERGRAIDSMLSIADIIDAMKAR